MVSRKERALSGAAIGVLGVNLMTGPVGDHLDVALELPPATVADPGVDLVRTTNSDPMIVVGSWSARTWSGEERAEAHRFEQEQPDQ